MELFNRWVGFMLMNILSIAYMGWYGIFNIILVSDITFLSWIILGIYFIVSISIGRKTYAYCNPKGKQHRKPQNTNIEWFVRDELINVGLIGTIIGLMVVLGPAFAAIDPSMTATITEALGFISLGVGTALWTTITALVCSVFIGAQLMNLERGQKSI
jgi:small-conductance mechanosensitive channel